MQHKLFVPVAFFLLMLSSCGKDGPQGISGATGPQGAAGPSGVVTYEFTNKVATGLPYNWQKSGNTGEIVLPYNSAAARTSGFTIPQDIVDSGLVVTYIRYFLGGPSDTATAAGMTDWYEAPYSVSVSATGGTFNISTVMDPSAFTIQLTGTQPATGFTSVPAVLRIVLIPAGQVYSIEQARRELHIGIGGQP